MVKLIRYRCTKKKLPFDLTTFWLADKLKVGTCEVTGLRFDLSGNINESPFLPSIDQIVPGKGYTRDNVQVVCLIYNYAKNCYSHEDVLTMAKALVAKP